MVEYNANKNVFRIIDIVPPGAKAIDEKWFAEDIAVTVTSNLGTVIVFDFSYNIASVIEYTLNGITWSEFNEGLDLVGGQSRYVRMTSNSVVNIRAKTAGAVINCIAGEP